jgi:hypothetical protein
MQSTQQQKDSDIKRLSPITSVKATTDNGGRLWSSPPKRATLSKSSSSTASPTAEAFQRFSSSNSRTESPTLSSTASSGSTKLFSVMESYTEHVGKYYHEIPSLDELDMAGQVGSLKRYNVTSKMQND